MNDVAEYLPLVRAIAGRLKARLPPNVELDDLVQVGMIGLIDSSTRFDPAQGIPFAAFAVKRARGAMVDQLRQDDWLPCSVRRNQRRIDAAGRAVQQKVQRRPTAAEMAAQLGVTAQRFRQLESEAQGVLVGLDEASRHLDGHAADPAATLADKEFRQALAALLEQLPPREQQAVWLHCEHDLTLKQIGEVLGVTESRVCQLHRQAVTRLRAGLQDHR